MGFFHSLFGRSKQDDSARFVSQDGFRQTLAKQTKMSPLTVAQLRKLGVAETAMLKLEFFFYTNTEMKAEGLASLSRQLGYDASSGPSAADRRIILVTGWTVPMKMDADTVTSWTEQMCRIGFEQDCAFDGWGTNAQ